MVFQRGEVAETEDDAICHAMLMCFTLEVVCLVGWLAGSCLMLLGPLVGLLFWR